MSACSDTEEHDVGGLAVGEGRLKRALPLSQGAKSTLFLVGAD